MKDTYSHFCWCRLSRLYRFSAHRWTGGRLPQPAVNILELSSNRGHPAPSALTSARGKDEPKPAGWHALCARADGRAWTLTRMQSTRACFTYCRLSSRDGALRRAHRASLEHRTAAYSKQNSDSLARRNYLGCRTYGAAPRGTMRQQRHRQPFSDVI